MHRTTAYRNLTLGLTALWMCALPWATSQPEAQAQAPRQAQRQAVAAAPAAQAAVASAAQAAAPATLKPLVDRYCVSCHNGRLKTAGLSLEGLDLAHVAGQAEVLEKVVKKVEARMMPPQGALQPDDATRTTLLTGLVAQLDREAAEHPNPGTTLLHRFNRAEYGNAIRDLLALDVDPATLLPPDDSSFGFDNIADVLKISPLLMERYIAAAEQISALAVGDVTQPKTAALYRVRNDLTQGEHLEGLPLGTRGGTHIRHTFPVDGEYIIKLRLWRTSVGFTRGLQREHDVEVSLDGNRVFLTQVGGRSDYETSVLNAAAIDASLESRLRTKIRVTAGPHDLDATFLAIAGGVLNGPEALSPTMFAVDPLYIHGVPGIESVIIEGPFDPAPAKDTPSRKAIFSCRPGAGAAAGADDAACARQILSRLARRAFRRPVTEDDLGPLLKMYASGKQEGSFEQGIQLALQGILTSPNFLFRAAKDPVTVKAGTPYRVNDLELASRLSFFLWSSIPDEQLLTVAAAGQLRQPAVLEREVRRMLNDPKSDALITNFGGQWLRLRNLSAFVPDRTDFPEFDDLLRQSMRRETEMFLESIVRDDRSALDLLRANYTFLNQRLARHYGIKGVYGSHFRRVPVTDPNRVGLLGQAAVLAVTSYPNRTSPVVRGRYILENIVGIPPAPPPPAVAASLPDEAKPKTMRDRMEVHRRNPVCASCHRVMDPLGFALENFDAVGAWRIRDGENGIDPTGTLYNGMSVDSPAALRKALLSTPELFVSTVTEKLLTYAIGRGVTADDQPAVRRIVRDAKPGDYTMSALILGVVKSAPFQMRMKPVTAGAGLVARAAQ